MRTQLRLDEELEKLAGTEREKVDLKEASNYSDRQSKFLSIESRLEALASKFPNFLIRKEIERGAEWYKRKE